MAERFNEEPKVRRAAPKADPAAASGRANEQDPVLDLQRQAGNRAVSEMLQGSASGSAGASPALRLRDALRAGRTAVQRELSLNVQRDLKSDTEKKDPAEARNEPAEEKMPSDSTEKLGSEEKDAPIGLKPFPADEDKAPNLKPFPSDEQKMPSDDAGQLGSDEDKIFDEEKVS